MKPEAPEAGQLVEVEPGDSVEWISPSRIKVSCGTPIKGANVKPEESIEIVSNIHASLSDGQKLLRLLDWDLKLELVPRDHPMLDSRYHETYARMDYDLARKSANIYLRRPDESHDSAYIPERSLLHELVHLHFLPFTNKLPSEFLWIEEQAVNALTNAIWGNL